MASGKSSARPADLMKYSSVMTSWDEGTKSVLADAQRAYAAWASDPKVVLQDMPGTQDVLSTFSGQLKGWWNKDDWVSRIALGFVDANKSPDAPDLSFDTSTQCLAGWGTSEDYLRAQKTTSVVTVDDTSLAAIAGDESHYQSAGYDPAKAKQLAQSIKNAKDPMALANALAQLPRDPNDAAYLATFYNALGADKVQQMATILQHTPGGLQALDDTLATASNSPLFKLTAQFGKELGYAGDPNRSAFELLLKYGAYSGGFLWMTAFEDWYKWGNTPNATVFWALSRNPQAARAILINTGEFEGPDGQAEAITPINTLLWDLREDPSLGPSGAALLKAVGGGPQGAQVRQYLINQGVNGNLSKLPDVDRSAIADIAAANIVEMAQQPGAEKFFEDLTKGKPDLGVQLAKAAIAQYTGSMPTFPPGTPDDVKQQALVTWAHTQGNALAVVMSAMQANGLEDAEGKTKSWEWKWFAGELAFNALLTTVTPEVEVESQIAKFAAETGIDGGKEGVFEWLEQNAKPDFTGQAMDQYNANARQIMSEQVRETTYLLYLRGDIPPAPPGMSVGTYLKDITEGYASTYSNSGSGAGFNGWLESHGFSIDQANLLTATLDGEISHDSSILGGD